MSRKGNVFDCAMEMLLLSIVEVSCSENGSQITAVNFKKSLPAISLTSAIILVAYDSTDPSGNCTS